MINDFIDALHTTSLHTDTFYTTHILWIHFIQLTFYGYILYNSHFTDTFYTTRILQDTSHTTKLHELANFC